MEAFVLFREGGFYAELFVDGALIDECGPFDDKEDADLASLRALRLSDPD